MGHQENSSLLTMAYQEISLGTTWSDKIGGGGGAGKNFLKLVGSVKLILLRNLIVMLANI